MAAKILVLEDDEIYRRQLVEALELGGYDVTPTASSPEAIAAATRSRFSLIIADVRLAGMDGLDCLAHLRTVQPTMRRIVITGFATADSSSRAIAVQAEDYLTKPITMRDLLAAVARVLRAPQEKATYAGLRALVRNRFRPDPDQLWTAVDSLRDLAWQSLYLGVRSRRLGETEALGLFDHLDVQDARREACKSEGLTKADVQTLSEGYRYAIDLAAAMCRGPLYSGAAKRPAEALSRQAFTRFFERVRSGEVSLEQLKLAPFLRTVPRAVLSACPPLQELHTQVWGSARLAA